MAPNAVLPGRRTPEDHDVVVREEKRDTEALAQAVSLARREGVRAWLTDEGYDFVLLEDFRTTDTPSLDEP
jgi:hypothetical protein